MNDRHLKCVEVLASELVSREVEEEEEEVFQQVSGDIFVG